MRQLNDRDRRNEVGCLCWCLVACVISLLAWPLMLLREVWQWRMYGLDGIEWDDVLRYSLAIAAGSVVNNLILIILLS